MIARRATPLLATLLAGALVAGCGSGGSSSTSGSTSTGAAAKTPTSTHGAAANTGTTGTTSTATNPASAGGVAQYAELCQSIIKKESNLTAKVKGKLEGICHKAAAGDVAGARAAAQEVCVEVITATPAPEAAKRKALAECKGG